MIAVEITGEWPRAKVEVRRLIEGAAAPAERHDHSRVRPGRHSQVIDAIAVEVGDGRGTRGEDFELEIGKQARGDGPLRPRLERQPKAAGLTSGLGHEQSRGEGGENEHA